MSRIASLPAWLKDIAIIKGTGLSRITVNQSAATIITNPYVSSILIGYNRFASEDKLSTSIS